MRWKTVTWFTVTMVAASAAHIIFNNDMFVTNAITGDLTIGETPQDGSISHNLDTLNPDTAPLTESSEVTEVPEAPEAPDSDIIITTTDTTQKPVETTTSTTTLNTENEIPDDKTTIVTQGNTDEQISTAPNTSPLSSSTTDSENILPDQIARSSEIVDEPGGVEGPEPDYVVLTQNGPVQGYPWRDNTDIIAYIDIPYGQFEGYFRDPTPAARWENVHQVREHSKRCPQMQGEDYVGVLDCLTLSIFTPSEPVNASVLVHIHESNFSHGSGDPTIYGPEYIVPKGIILVLPNYRLGPLGFLCMRNAVAPGNAGLKDLTLALKWIKQNIALFGGDPTNVVVSGEGTSGALVGYLALSPSSNGYINKVITESGSVLSYWALNRDPESISNALVQTIRELSTSNITMEGRGAETIVRASRFLPFIPCVEHNDNAFISSTPWALLHNRPMNIAFMIGSASHAGAFEASFINDHIIEGMNSNFGQYLPSDLRFHDQTSRATVGDQLKHQYFGNSSITLDHLEEMSLWFTDCGYLGPAIRTARALLGAGANVFFYEFAFVGELNRELDSMNSALNRTVRGDIVGYLFSQDGMVPEKGTDERRMVDLMVELWTNFITEGKPSAGDVTWHQLNTTTADEEQWLHIGEELEMRRGLHVHRLPLWTSIYRDHFIEHNLGFQNLANICLLLPLVLWSLKM